jgi:spore maturation protein CgeB
LTQLSVIVYGDDKHGSGGWCYARALERHGCHVSTLSDWAGLEKYSSALRLRAFRRLYGRVRESDRRQHVVRLNGLVDANKPDIVMVLKGLHLGPADVSRYKTAGAWVVNVNHDDFFSRYRLNRTQLQHSAIHAYDHILTTREVNVEEIRPLNPKVEFFAFAYEPALHRQVPIPPDEAAEWGVDVVFVGTYAAHRAWMLERLVSTVPARYAVYGAGWHKLALRSPLRSYVRPGTICGDVLCKALGGAAIALGFLRRENRDDYTQRTFEIPACGGLLLAERTPRHRIFYREGIEAEFFDPDDPAELISKVRGLLADPSSRAAIRAAGLASLARNRHTYDDRISQLITLYKNTKKYT